MKKYPVTYKGKEYEVRWEDYFGYYLTIYEVKRFWKIKFYISRYRTWEVNIEDLVSIPENDPNYYIEEVMELFKLWEAVTQKEKEEKTVEINKQKSLAEWNGVIE